GWFGMFSEMKSSPSPPATLNAALFANVIGTNVAVVLYAAFAFFFFLPLDLLSLIVEMEIKPVCWPSTSSPLVNWIKSDFLLATKVVCDAGVKSVIFSVPVNRND